MNKLTNGIISKCKNFSKTSYINKFDAQFSKNSEKSNIFRIAPKGFTNIVLNVLKNNFISISIHKLC